MSYSIRIENPPPREGGKPSKAEQFLVHGVLKQGASISPDKVCVGGSDQPDLPVLALGREGLEAHGQTPKISEFHGHTYYDNGTLVTHTFDVTTCLGNPSYLPVMARHAANLVLASRKPELLDRPAVALCEPPTQMAEAVFDLEWDRNGQITMVGFADSGDEAYVTHGNTGMRTAIDMVYRGARIIGHNVINADLPKIGVPPLSYSPKHVWDTMLAAHLVHAHFAQLGLLDLGSLVRFYFPTSDWKHGQYDLATYNGYDCAYNYRLYKALERDLVMTGQEHLLEMQQQLEHLSGLMYSRGVAIDTTAVGEFVEARTADKERLKCSLPINPNSPKQVIAFAKSRGIRISNCQADTLDKHRGKDADLDLVIEYRADNKNPSTWFKFDMDNEGKCIGVDPYIYPRFHVTGTAVDRFSSSGPNFQNLPPELRRFIVPRDASMEFIACDAAQAENRWVAFIAKDDRMMEDFLSGQDIHSIIAARISAALGHTIDRKTGKTVVHASNYGETHYNLARRIFGSVREEALDKASRFQHAYFKAYPKVAAWHSRLKRQLDGGDLKLVNPYGRVRFIYELQSHDRLKKAAHFLGCSPSARNVNNKTWEVYQATGLVPVLIVHDEIVWEVERGDTRTRRIIGDILTQPIPEMGGMLGAWEMKVGRNYGKHSETNPEGLCTVEISDQTKRIVA